jgi:type III pantothenate kinase
MAIQLDIISIEGSIYTLFAIDIGNSAIKIFSSGELIRLSYRTDWLTDISNFFKSLEHQHTLFVISSVNDEKFSIIKSIIEKNSFHKFMLVLELLKNQQIIDLLEIEGIGSDRVLGLMGALQYSASPLITIDCGTATTMNFLAENNVCKGGTIMPGIFTQFRSLVENTSKLKYIKLIKPEHLLGKNTNQSISSGILNGTIGAIQNFITQIQSQEEKEISVFLTGGNAFWIADLLQVRYPNLKIIPTLVLDGIKYLAKNSIN